MSYVADRARVVIASSRYGWRVIIESQATIDNFVNLKYELSITVSFVGIRYSMCGLLSDMNNCLTRIAASNIASDNVTN